MTSTISEISNNDVEGDKFIGPNQGCTTLFGRKDEFSSLMNIYEHVKKTRSFGKVSVRGDSGTGKTSLVAALGQSLVTDNGFFCSGKYFQCADLAQEPYSAIIAAFSDLCDVVLQSSDFNEEWRAMIEEELGSDCKLLINVVSNISPFLAKNDDNQYYTHSEYAANIHYCSAEKLKHAFKSFVRAMCSTEHTVAIFIDDIQWMDEGSKDLLGALLQDTSIRNFLLILAYRDNHKNSVETAFPSQMNFDLNIHLNNLDPECVKQIVRKELKITSDLVPNNIGALSNLIVQRTHCNPFHVKQFIKLITTQQLIVYDRQSCTWLFDVNTVQKRTMITESLAEVLSNKITLLHSSTIKVLKLLSLLGYCFTSRMAFDFCSDLSLEGPEKGGDLPLEMSFDKAIEANFIEKTRDGYQFTHDKIQGAFQEIMDITEKEKLHLLIGYKFLSKSNQVFKYTAAIHFNCAIGHFTDGVEGRVFLAKSNFEASKYCESVSAFSDARGFVRRGLNILGNGEEKWWVDFELACAMTESLAKLEFTLGDVNAFRCANRDILDRTKSEKVKARALLREIKALTSADYDDANVILSGKKILSELGIKVPLVITPFHFLSKLKRVRRVFDSKGDSELLSLPRMHSDLTCALAAIMCTGFYFMRHGHYVAGLYTDLLAIEFTLANGLFAYSTITFLNFGRAEILLGQEERAYRMLRMASQLCSLAPAHLTAYVHFLSALLRQRERFEMKKQFFFTPEFLNNFLEGGNVVMPTIFGCFSFFVRQWTGEHLESLERSIRVIHGRLNALDQRAMITYFEPLLQFVLNLRNEDERRWEKLVVLNGECMNEAEYSRRLPFMHQFSGSNFNFSKMVLAYMFGFYKEAEQINETFHLRLIQRKSVLAFPIYLFRSLTFFALYEVTGCRRYLRKARQTRKLFQSKGNPNATPYLRVLEAVELSLKPNISMSKVCTAFDGAIRILKQESMTHLEALANERAGFALLKRETGERLKSKAFHQRALEVYQNEWGAIAKYRWLRAKISSESYSDLVLDRAKSCEPQ